MRSGERTPGRDPVDLLVRGTLVDVLTGTLRECAVAVDDGEVVSLDPPDSDRPADRELRAAYVAPGLIDAHTHIEASMVTLSQYGDAVVPRGVISVVHDPHEIANVLGVEGVRAFVADADRTPLKARITVPSSVPASGLQDAGATVDADAVATLLDDDRAVALGEVMDVPGLVAGDEGVRAKVRAARERGLAVDGHAPGVTGDRLQAAARFLDNDHESAALAEAREKADAGLRVYLREGSTSRNLADLVGLVDEIDSRRFSLCTDERNPADLLAAGGVDHAVREAMHLGVDPMTAVQLATVNTAEAYDLPFGKVTPGAPADLVLLSDLESWTVEHVVVDGTVDPVDDVVEPVDEDADAATDGASPSAPDLTTDTVDFAPVEAADLAIEHPGPGPVTVRVQSAVGDFRTERLTAAVPVETEAPPRGTDAVLVADTTADVLPMAVIERHGGTESEEEDAPSIGRGFVHNLGLDRGAVGTTVAHDAHNCVVAGRTHETMAAVANRLREVGGGICVYDSADGSFTTLELPVAGLVADAPLESVAADFEAVDRAATDIGLSVHGGLLELTYQSLEVIPTYRLTNRGLVDVERGELVDVVAE
jgi:adenine deaminase